MKGAHQKTPRILFVGHVPPPVHGAAQIGKFLIESEVIRRSFALEVVPIQMEETINRLGKFRLAKLAATARLYIEVIETLRRKHIDAIYLSISVSGLGFVRDFFTVKIARVFGTPLIFHMHSMGLKCRYDKSWLLRWMYRSTFKDAYVIHLSKLLYPDVQPVVSPDRFYVVANGVPDPLNDYHSFGKGSPVPTVLFLSNLLESKGPLELLRACQCLLSQGIPHRLVFAGAEMEARIPSVIRRVAARTPGWIQLLPPVYGPAKHKLLQSADIFVLPSHTECQPLAIIEAMAHGLAVVSTTEGAIAELIRPGRDGLLVPSRDVKSLERALRVLLLDVHLRASLSRSARARFLERFTIERFQDRFVSVLSEITRGL